MVKGVKFIHKKKKTILRAKLLLGIITIFCQSMIILNICFIYYYSDRNLLGRGVKMKKDLLRKTLVLGVIILFVGAGVQSVFAVDIPEKEEIEPKDYLFETIVAISNNPDVQDLLDEYKNNFNFDLNNQYIFRQLFFKNPDLLCSMVFTKTKTTSQYIDKTYNQGIELINIFGEEKAYEMLDSIELTNPELLDDLNNIIINDEELSNRISTLEELNNETSDICKILFILGIRDIVKWMVLDWMENIFYDVPYLRYFFMVRTWLVVPQVYIILDLLTVFDCWWT